jgi:chromate transport protein ChrA
MIKLIGFENSSIRNYDFLRCYRFELVILSGKIKDRTHAEKLDTIFLCLLIGSVTYTIYRVTGYFMNRVDTPSKAYWHLLADAFNHGHLNLIAPPTTHDLTLYNGKWYVPNPPLPAILLMPVVALLGVEGREHDVVSALLGAMNVVIVYLVLQCASESGMTACKRSTNLWLTAVFALSTNHIWLATTGQMWFISQLVTILFIGLGTIAVIQGKPAWVSGLMIGMAVLARPNIFPIAIFLMGIYLWKAKPFPEVEWGKAVRWAWVWDPVTICGF